MTRSRVTSLLTAFLVVAAGALATAQQRFRDELSVVVVEVPVQVLRDGEPVKGLTAADFEVTEGRKAAEIVGFEVVDLTIRSDGEEQPDVLPVAARRHFLLFFDLSFSSPSAIVRAREAAKELVRSGMHASDLVGVATYTSSEGIRLPLGFTSDRRQVELAIDTLGLPQLVESVRDPLGLVLADSFAFSDVGSSSIGGGATASGRPDAEAEIRELVEDMETSGRTDAQRNSILALTSAMGGLAEVLHSVDGRKHVIFLSEGFDSSILLGQGRGIDAAEQRAIQERNEAAMRGEVWSVDSDERFGNTSTQSLLTNVLQEFVRAGATIQAVDIGVLRTGGDQRPRASGEDGLFIMADETGGQFLRNYNDLTSALSEVMERTSVTYLLAFRPREVEYDGKYHEIKVRLKNEQRGVRLVHRPGYFAPKPLAQQAPLERRFSTAERILSGEAGGDLAVDVLAGAFPNPGSDRAYVPVIVEIDGPALLAGHSGNVLPLEVYGYAMASDGTVRDFFTQAMQLDLAKAGDALRGKGLKFWGNLELPPGSYRIRVMVRNSATGASTLLIAPVRVPEEATAVLLPPMVPESPQTWLLGRQSGVDPTQYPYPFMLAGEPFIPAARPTLQAGSTVRLGLAGYHLGAGELAARAELTSSAGETVEGVQLALDGRISEGQGFERFTAALSVGAVPAGSYELRVMVRDQETGSVHEVSLPITVAG